MPCGPRKRNQVQTSKPNTILLFFSSFPPITFLDLSLSLSSFTLHCLSQRTTLVAALCACKHAAPLFDLQNDNPPCFLFLGSKFAFGHPKHLHQLLDSLLFRRSLLHGSLSHACFFLHSPTKAP